MHRLQRPAGGGSGRGDVVARRTNADVAGERAHPSVASRCCVLRLSSRHRIASRMAQVYGFVSKTAWLARPGPADAVCMGDRSGSEVVDYAVVGFDGSCAVVYDLASSYQLVRCTHACIRSRTLLHRLAHTQTDTSRCLPLSHCSARAHTLTCTSCRPAGVVSAVCVRRCLRCMIRRTENRAAPGVFALAHASSSRLAHACGVRVCVLISIAN